MPASPTSRGCQRRRAARCVAGATRQPRGRHEPKRLRCFDSASTWRSWQAPRTRTSPSPAFPAHRRQSRHGIADVDSGLEPREVGCVAVPPPGYSVVASGSIRAGRLPGTLGRSQQPTPPIRRPRCRSRPPGTPPEPKPVEEPEPSPSASATLARREHRPPRNWDAVRGRSEPRCKGSPRSVSNDRGPTGAVLPEQDAVVVTGASHFGDVPCARTRTRFALASTARATSSTVGSRSVTPRTGTLSPSPAGHRRTKPSAVPSSRVLVVPELRPENVTDCSPRSWGHHSDGSRTSTV